MFNHMVNVGTQLVSTVLHNLHLLGSSHLRHLINCNIITILKQTILSLLYYSVHENILILFLKDDVCKMLYYIYL